MLNASGFGTCLASGGTNLQPLLLRVRRALDYQDMPWQLRYIGQPEIGESLQIKFFSIICFIHLLLCVECKALLLTGTSQKDSRMG
jgi:hypothetical protein